MQTSDTFNFFMPIEISKGSTTATGKPEKMMFKGIASTADKDSDGENLMQEGFDLTPFQKFGFVNWDHQTKTSPAAIIGEPVLAEMRKGGMYVEVELYDTPLACQVYEAAQVLAKSNSKRSFGFSIEGKATERGSNDPKHPDYKIIKKAMITGLAITPAPKNRCTLAQIMKGEGGNTDPFDFAVEEGSDETEYIINVERDGRHVLIDANLNIIIRKSMSTEVGSGRPVIPEEVEGVNNPAVKTKPKKKCPTCGDEDCMDGDCKKKVAKKKKISKSEVFENIFPYLSNDINKANDFYSIAAHFEREIDSDNQHSSIMVSPEALQLATDFINKFEPAAIVKSQETAPLVVVAPVEDLAAAEGLLRGLKKSTADANLLKSEDAVTTDYIEKGRPAPVAAAPAGPDFAAMFGQLTEALSGVMTRQGEQFNAGLKSIETLVQTSLEKGDSQSQVLSRLADSLEEIGNQPAGTRKSVATSRYLEKGGSSSQRPGMQQLSIGRNKREIITLLDIEADITLEKGEITNIGNPDMANAMQVFESSSTLPQHIIERIALSKNIQIVA